VSKRLRHITCFSNFVALVTFEGGKFGEISDETEVGKTDVAVVKLTHVEEMCDVYYRKRKSWDIFFVFFFASFLFCYLFLGLLSMNSLAYALVFRAIDAKRRERLLPSREDRGRARESLRVSSKCEYDDTYSLPNRKSKNKHFSYNKPKRVIRPTSRHLLVANDSSLFSCFFFLF
jgi:hypothetical protein